MSEESSGMSKGITGCGGCGCLLGLLALVIGGGLALWGSTDSKVDELIGPGIALAGSSVFIGIIGLIVLIVGIVMMKKKEE